jgi:hypothetical protein
MTKRRTLDWRADGVRTCATSLNPWQRPVRWRSCRPASPSARCPWARPLPLDRPRRRPTRHRSFARPCRGVRLPADAVMIGAPVTSEHRGDPHQSQMDVRLASSTAPTALDSLSGELTRLGWEVRRGSSDVFAVRRAGDRWELFQARVDTGHSPSFHGVVLVVGTGSRPA